VIEYHCAVSERDVLFSNDEFEARALSTGVGHACGVIDAPAE
jgi:hypothetical protein